jgi:hypothetical protein
VTAEIIDSWNTLVGLAVFYGKIEISKDMIANLEDPSMSGLFSNSIGAPRGQSADWRSSVDGSKLGVHLVEFENRYEIHTDRFDPSKDIIRHLIFDFISPAGRRK